MPLNCLASDYFSGGNTGIGKTTALELAKKGARVIIASRNILKSEKACQDIIQQSKNLNVSFGFDWLFCDYSDTF